MKRSAAGGWHACRRGDPPGRRAGGAALERGGEAAHPGQPRGGHAQPGAGARRSFRKRPPTLVSASAVGYYGSRGDEVLTRDFGARQRLPGRGLRGVGEGGRRRRRRSDARRADADRRSCSTRAAARSQQMLPPFRMGVGGKLGGGKQWMSWIHLAGSRRHVQVCGGESGQGAAERGRAQSGHQCGFHEGSGRGAAPAGHLSGAGIRR